MAETINQRLSSKRYQAIRLVDVFVLAPTMVYASSFKSLPDYIRLILLVSGICTLVFNGINYLDIKKEKMDKQHFAILFLLIGVVMVQNLMIYKKIKE